LLLLLLLLPPTAGVKDLKVLKTTQSGYEGFLRDEFTLLQEVRDRIMATSVTATWKVRHSEAAAAAAASAVAAANTLQLRMLRVLRTGSR
jgi:urate oxidase